MNNWNLDKLYPSFESKEFKADLVRLDENIAELNGYKDRLDDSVETVEGYLKTLIKSATLYRTLGAFSSLTKSTNTSDSNAINSKQSYCIEPKQNQVFHNYIEYCLPSQFFHHFELQYRKHNLYNPHQ